MNEEREVRDVLRGALPPQPSTEGWVADARSRHRRRQTATGAVAAALVLGLAVPVIWNLTDDGARTIPADPTPSPSVTATNATPTPSPTQTPSPEPSPSVSTTPVETFAAPVQTADTQAMEHCIQYANTTVALPDGRFPDGAERLWMCDMNTEGDIAWVGPMEPLTVGLDDVLAKYNDAEVISEERNCSQAVPYGRSMTVVAEYADGARYVVRAIPGGCDMLTDGQVARNGGQQWVETLNAAWQAQRTAGEVRLETVPLDCAFGDTVLDYEPRGGTRGAICGVPQTESDDSVQPEARPISGELLARVVADVQANSTTEPIPTTMEGPIVYAARTSITGSAIQLNVHNEWGDPLNLYYHAPDTWLWHQNGVLRRWQPSGQLAADLGELIDDLRMFKVHEDTCTAETAALDKGSLDGAYGGVVCVDGQSRGSIDPATAQAIATGFATEGTVGDDPQTTGRQLWLMVGNRLVALDQTTAGGLVRVTDDGRTVGWTPSAEVTEVLGHAGIEW